MDVLNTPSEAVQRAVSDCLSPLVVSKEVFFIFVFVSLCLALFFLEKALESFLLSFCGCCFYVELEGLLCWLVHKAISSSYFDLFGSVPILG